MTSIELGLSTIFILISVIYTGAMLEKKTWVFHLELIRMVLIFLLVYCWLPSSILIGLMFLLITPGIVFYKTLCQQYNRILFGFQ